MFKLTTPTSLPLLNLPASALAALSNEILGPVDDIDLFTAFWNETGTLLWHLNHDDTLPEDPLLAVALANPEYVTALMMCTLWAGTKCVGFKVAFDSFSSAGWWKWTWLNT